MRKVLCIFGPTATGKSDLAIALAQKIEAEIINVDSALIYREMDIGTAKPSILSRKGVPHHLIDIINPDQSFSVADFLSNVELLLAEIASREKIPILVGGTMMYFFALQNGLIKLPQIGHTIKDNLNQRAITEGLDNLYQELVTHDPKLAQKIHAHDFQRIIRGLEIFYGTGIPLSAWQDSQHKNNIASNYEFYNVCLMPSDRALLHENINSRFIGMLKQGLVNEVYSLQKKWSLNKDNISMRSVGYRQVLRYILGEINYDEMLNQAQAASRQLAKRQLTWCRSWKKIDFILDKIPLDQVIIDKTIDEIVSLAFPNNYGV